MEEPWPWPCGLLRLCWENNQPLCPQWSSRDPFAFLPETMKLQITLCDPGLEAARGTEEGEGVAETSGRGAGRGNWGPAWQTLG